MSEIKFLRRVTALRPPLPSTQYRSFVEIVPMDSLGLELPVTIAKDVRRDIGTSCNTTLGEV